MIPCCALYQPSPFYPPSCPPALQLLVAAINKYYAFGSCFVGVEVLWPRDVGGNLRLAVPRVPRQQVHLRVGKGG